MIKIIQLSNPKQFSAVCPGCSMAIDFYISFAPVYCDICGIELPNFGDLIKYLEDRVEFFKTGMSDRMKHVCYNY